jgi:hypothetical protein
VNESQRGSGKSRMVTLSGTSPRPPRGPFPLVLLYVLVPLIVPYPYSTLPYVVMAFSCGPSTKQLRGSPGP